VPNLSKKQMAIIIAAVLVGAGVGHMVTGKRSDAIGIVGKVAGAGAGLYAAVKFA